MTLKPEHAQLQSRSGQWQLVEERISRDIASGALAPGDRLPTEAEIMEQFGVGRHSVRRAIAELASAGKVRAEQGRGTFVEEHSVITYNIARRTRFRRNLLEQGRVPSGQPVTEVEIAAPPTVAAALGLKDEEKVYMIVRRGFADDVPISIGHSYHPVERFPNMHLRRRAGESVTDIYAAFGIPDYLRRSTTILTRRATAEEARLLAQSPQQPVLVVQKTDVDLKGRPIAYSETVWAGERVQFTIENDPDEAGPKAKIGERRHHE
ncbi:phosphonate metabolism transcriptional regulator PhnF [Rhizobium sp. BK251]|uniref:phosphonate metabolism transcriptional regulator PhnF n=1 Tax=Rhizobium sp. BK251 TaxID=2512125 RepID=UPI0010489276|nr:phosphonate metabolism transcriptional regulator PhnF [Rhizobium sp. BK251]TCL67244.1 GntR family transcriptional regulator [Rhizobium sp. BK251]